jgi:hypothetical protein
MNSIIATSSRKLSIAVPEFTTMVSVNLMTLQPKNSQRIFAREYYFKDFIPFKAVGKLVNIAVKMRKILGCGQSRASALSFSNSACRQGAGASEILSCKSRNGCFLKSDLKSSKGVLINQKQRNSIICICPKYLRARLLTGNTLEINGRGT